MSSRRLVVGGSLLSGWRTLVYEACYMCGCSYKILRVDGWFFQKAFIEATGTEEQMVALEEYVAGYMRSW